MDLEFEWHLGFDSGSTFEPCIHETKWGHLLVVMRGSYAKNLVGNHLSNQKIFGLQD
jgi:hypothetical protein